MANDRDLIVKVAMYNYTEPAHQTALSGTFSKYRLPQESIVDNWVKYSPEEAKEKILSLGYKKSKNGYWLDKNNNEIYITIGIVSGWADWIRAGQIISRNRGSMIYKRENSIQRFPGQRVGHLPIQCMKV